MVLLSALLRGVEGFGAHHRSTGPTPDVDLKLGPGLGAVGRHVGHPDPALQARRERAAGHHAAAADRTALAGDPPARHLNRDDLLLRTRRPHRSDLLGADEAGLLPAAPAQPGLDRPPIL